MLDNAVKDRSSPFRIPVFICGDQSDLDGRIVVLRKSDQSNNIDNQLSETALNGLNKKLNDYDWFNKGKIIASFISIKSEISTNDLNQYLLSLGKILCLPVIENDKEVLIFKKYSIGDELKKGKFGVREPVNSLTQLPDIIFVPCLAFD